MHIFSKDLFFSIFSIKPDYLQAKVTIVPDPSDSTVTLTATGYSQSGNSIDVPIGTVVRWEVEKTAYDPREGEFLVVGNTSISVKLSEQPKRTVSINTVPADASVLITGDGYINAQGTKALSAPIGTKLTYTVSDPLGQLSLVETGSITVQEDVSLNVTMKTKAHITEITPPDAVVKINGTVGTYRELPCSQTITVSATRDDFDSFSKTVPLNNRGIAPDFVDKIELKETTYTLVVESTPTNASLSVVVGGKTYTGTGRVVVNNVLPGTSIKATGTLAGYDTNTITGTMPKGDYPLSVPLNETLYPVTITATPSEASVVIKIDGSQVASGTGKATTSVKRGTSITYEASYEGAKETAGPITISSTYSASLVLDATETTEGEVTLLTTTTTKNLGVGKYSYILIGAGGDGGARANTIVSGTFTGVAGPSAGGGGAGYVSKGTFVISSRQDIVFNVASSSSGTTKITNKDGSSVLASVSNGGDGLSTGNGGNGSSGGGAGGMGLVGADAPYAGGKGGKGGYNGSSAYSAHVAGKGVKNSNLQYEDNAGSAAPSGGSSTSAKGTPGGGGKGCASLQSTLITKSGFDAATTDTLYAVMSGGGGGGGDRMSSRPGTSQKTITGQTGGGGGGWNDGTEGTSTTKGSGGSGAILYRRIAWS